MPATALKQRSSSESITLITGQDWDEHSAWFASPIVLVISPRGYFIINTFNWDFLGIVVLEI